MMQHARRLFVSAALYNWSAGAAFLVLADLVGPLLGLDTATGSNLAFRDLGLALGIAFGIAYWRVAFNPRRYRSYIELGIIGKGLVVLAVYGHWLAGHIRWQLPALAFGDVVFALLFMEFLSRYPE